MVRQLASLGASRFDGAAPHTLTPWPRRCSANRRALGDGTEGSTTARTDFFMEISFQGTILAPPPETAITGPSQLHGGPSSSAFSRPFQRAVSDCSRAFAACCRLRSPDDVFFPGRDCRAYGFRFRRARSKRSGADGAEASVAGGIARGDA